MSARRGRWVAHNHDPLRPRLTSRPDRGPPTQADRSSGVQDQPRDRGRGRARRQHPPCGASPGSQALRHAPGRFSSHVSEPSVTKWLRGVTWRVRTPAHLTVSCPPELPLRSVSGSWRTQTRRSSPRPSAHVHRQSGCGCHPRHGRCPVPWQSARSSSTAALPLVGVSVARIHRVGVEEQAQNTSRDSPGGAVP